MELFQDKVPRTVLNFLTLTTGRAENKNMYYKGTKFHRIIPGFCIQGGDYENGDGTGGSSIYGKYFEDENFIFKHDKPGLLSMANSGPNTNGSQFFITLGYAPHLDNSHVVFGCVRDGMDIVKKMEQYGTESGKPLDVIKIIRCGQL